MISSLRMDAHMTRRRKGSTSRDSAARSARGLAGSSDTDSRLWDPFWVTRRVNPSLAAQSTSGDTLPDLGDVREPAVDPSTRRPDGPSLNRRRKSGLVRKSRGTVRGKSLALAAEL